MPKGQSRKNSQLINKWIEFGTLQFRSKVRICMSTRGLIKIGKKSDSNVQNTLVKISITLEAFPSLWCINCNFNEQSNLLKAESQAHFCIMHAFSATNHFPTSYLWIKGLGVPRKWLTRAYQKILNQNFSDQKTKNIQFLILFKTCTFFQILSRLIPIWSRTLFFKFTLVWYRFDHGHFLSNSVSLDTDLIGALHELFNHSKKVRIVVYREKLCKVHSLSEDDVKHKHHFHSVHFIHLFKLTLILYVSAFVYVIQVSFAGSRICNTWRIRIDRKNRRKDC